MSLHVLIAGAGLGGLTLAHGLRKAGVDVTVYERDPRHDFRLQGYRIHIDAPGHTALAECLPEDLYELYIATSTATPDKQVAMFFDHRFDKTGEGDARAGDFTPARSPTAVNRHTLRQILLTGLDGALRFGRELVGYEQTDAGVQAHFADGSVANGDVLVAADGINSVVRHQLLPHAEICDTGVRAITGKTTMAALEADFPEELHNTFTGVHGPDYRTLAMAEYRSRRPQQEAATELVPDARLDPVPDYLMWLQLAPVGDLPIREQALWRTDSATLHGIALDMLDGWHPTLRRLVERADKPSTFPLSVRAVLPVNPWQTSNVTLLGDAIHAMAPIGGRGANTALCDAASLSAKLRAADRGQLSLYPAIAEYESRMREQGQEAVIASLHKSGPSLGARSPYSPEQTRTAS
ncbi:FAD-dependent oxidoreductase [Haloactinomyces albus]|uniref:2-polyprenyl-6-methoxyphenol hydroxylase-like FAD-dependent oxidoreductase n=1 Tax=Haloactinomyces albus TaxID=1352928 RepID=A0AAE3ZBQ1_9ACTN|nr:NAD(P)/FAD-dependent oxidoreductase [Haloactinomyces albus]MDR7301983.1 2-polyprenyl-6-methoxyphenol hydroxylase-like FAD-dependent oxidoreductase [Haloactinomyces albus]